MNIAKVISYNNIESLQHQLMLLKNNFNDVIFEANLENGFLDDKNYKAVWGHDYVKFILESLKLNNVKGAFKKDYIKMSNWFKKEHILTANEIFLKLSWLLINIKYDKTTNLITISAYSRNSKLNLSLQYDIALIWAILKKIHIDNNLIGFDWWSHELPAAKLIFVAKNINYKNNEIIRQFKIN